MSEETKEFFGFMKENNYFDYLIPAERLFEWSGE